LGRLSKMILGACVALVAAYVALLVWFRVNEDALLFHPDKGPVIPPPDHLGLQSRDVNFASGDGTALVARLIPPPNDASVWILYFHGAAGNVGTLGYNEAWAKFRRLGLGVFAVDYRGYGESGGSPSEAGMYRDAEAAYGYLTNDLHIPPNRVLIYGYSLGSAVAIDLASRVLAAGLMVEGALLSIPKRGAELYPYVPVNLLARNRFASVEKIAKVNMPKLLIHAREDVYVPIAHGRRLFELASGPKYFQDVAGSHTTAHEVDPEFFKAITRFIVGLGLTLQ
jgi:uncharacterized protein